MYCLDTNSLIYFFKNMGQVAENLLAKSPKDIGVPAIVVYELEVGIAKSNNPKKRKAQLNALLSQIEVLPFGHKEAEIAAKIRAFLEQQGTPIGAYDTLIAATALSHKATLVTHNTSEFKRVKNLEIEDWY